MDTKTIIKEKNTSALWSGGSLFSTHYAQPLDIEQPLYIVQQDIETNMYIVIFTKCILVFSLWMVYNLVECATYGCVTFTCLQIIIFSVSYARHYYWYTYVLYMFN